MKDETLIREIAQIKAYHFVTLSLVRYHVEYSLRNDGRDADLKAPVQGWVDHLTEVFEADLRTRMGLSPQKSAEQTDPLDLSHWPDVLDNIGNDEPDEDG